MTALSNSTEDVYHFKGSGTSANWVLHGERDSIDITDLSMTPSGNDVTISLTIMGGITNSSTLSYYIHLQQDATSYYAVYYTNGSGMATGNGDLAGYVDTNPTFSISADGKTLSYTFTDVKTNEDYSL